MIPQTVRAGSKSREEMKQDQHFYRALRNQPNTTMSNFNEIVRRQKSKSYSVYKQKQLRSAKKMSQM